MPAVLLSLLPAVAPAAQSPHASRLAFARTLLAAATRGDSAALAAALAPRFPAEGGAAMRSAHHLLMRLGAQGGALELLRTDTSAANTMLTVAAARWPRHAVVNIGWNRTDAEKLRYVELLKAWDPAATRLDWTPARGVRAIADRLHANVGALARMGAYSGTVLVAHGDSIVFARGYGWANLDDSVRNAVRTRYHTASMGKMFTAIAIGQLVERGALRLDDTLARLLPDYPNAERARQITVRQLLGHTAGLGDLWSHPGFRRGPFTTNRALAHAVASGPLAFTPGTRWSYSNEGYTVLGAIVEQRSGQAFEAYLREHVWKPAGMDGVMIAGGDRTVPHRALGYAPGEDDVLGVEPLQPTMATLGRTSAAQGAGGQYATATDFLRLAQALRAGRLLSPAMRDTLWQGGRPLPWDATARYASGFMRFDIAGHGFVGHGGGGGYGIDNMLYFSASGPWTVVVLGNLNPPGATDLAAAIARFVAGSDVAPAPARGARARR